MGESISRLPVMINSGMSAIGSRITCCGGGRETKEKEEKPNPISNKKIPKQSFLEDEDALGSRFPIKRKTLEKRGTKLKKKLTSLNGQSNSFNSLQISGSSIEYEAKKLEGKGEDDKFLRNNASNTANSNLTLLTSIEMDRNKPLKDKNAKKKNVNSAIEKALIHENETIISCPHCFKRQWIENDSNFLRCFNCLEFGKCSKMKNNKIKIEKLQDDGGLAFKMYFSSTK